MPNNAFPTLHTTDYKPAGMQQQQPINQHYQRRTETPAQTAARLAASRQQAAARRKAEAEKQRQQKRSRIVRTIVIISAIVLIAITFFAAQYTGTLRGQQDARQRIEQENDLTAGPKSLI